MPKKKARKTAKKKPAKKKVKREDFSQAAVGIVKLATESSD